MLFIVTVIVSLDWWFVDPVWFIVDSLISKSGNKSFDATIASTYQMGKEELSYIQFGSAQIRGYIASEYGFKAGSSIQVGLKERGVFLFETETGERIR